MELQFLNCLRVCTTPGTPTRRYEKEENNLRRRSRRNNADIPSYGNFYRLLEMVHNKLLNLLSSSIKREEEWCQHVLVLAVEARRRIHTAIILLSLNNATIAP